MKIRSLRFGRIAVATIRSRPKQMVAAATILSVLVAAGSVPAMAGTALKKKAPLSQTAVTIETGPNAVDGALFVALDQGLFAKYGLNVTWLENGGGGATDITLIEGGAAQFSFSTASNEIIAAQQGAPFRALLIPSVGGPQQVEVTAAFAAKSNMPTAGGTQKQALAQLMAFKGTHAVVAISTASSNAAVWLAAAAHKYGLTYGAGCTTCDINLDAVGTVPNEVTAFLAGKVDGLANVPPYTDQANGVVVQYGHVAPLNNTLTTFVIGTITEIQQHPDATQALVNGFVYSMEVWRKAHKALAETDIENTILQYGVAANQAAAIYSTKVQELYFKNPYPTRFEYNTTLATYNLTSSTPYTLPYATFVDPVFVAKALKSFGLPLGT